MKKKLLSLLLVCTLVLGMVPGAALAAETESPFTDVKTTDWFFDAVQYAYDHNLMSGTGNNHFSPSETTTRGMMVTILHNMEGKPAAGSPAFTDVPAGEWYAAPVAWASAHGIVSGYGNGRFGPNDPITREQMVVMLRNYAEYKEYETSDTVDLSQYADTAAISDYAYASIQWAVGEGIISGVTATTIQPQGDATRAQMAQVLMAFRKNQEALAAFLAKDVEDFAGYEVIQAGDSTETNYMVLAEDTIVASATEETNQLTSADEEQGIYSLSHIDATVADLKPGDILYIPYREEPLLLKVGAIQINGSSATITAQETTLSELFTYIDLEMDVPVSEMYFDPSTADEGVSFSDPGTQELGTTTQAEFAAGQLGDVFHDEFPLVNITGDYFEATLEVDLWLTARIRFDGFAGFQDAQLSLKQETAAEISASASVGEGERIEKSLGNLSIPITWPLSAEFSLYATFDMDASVAGSITATFTSEFGGIYKNGKAKAINEHDGEINADLRGEFATSVGIGVEGGLKAELPVIVTADISLNGEAGVQVGGVVEKSYSSSAKPAVLHSCPLCVDGEIDFLLSLGMNFNLDIFLQDAFDKHISLANEKIPFRDFYISFGGGEDPVEFGWGKCPHMQYLVTIWAEDQNGTAVGNAQIEISGSGQEDIAGTTTGNGVFQTYCADGRYTISATAEGYEDGQASLRVNGKPAEVTVEMEKETQEGVYEGVLMESFTYYTDEYPAGSTTLSILSPTEGVVHFSYSSSILPPCSNNYQHRFIMTCYPSESDTSTPGIVIIIDTHALDFSTNSYVYPAADDVDSFPATLVFDDVSYDPSSQSLTCKFSLPADCDVNLLELDLDNMTSSIEHLHVYGPLYLPEERNFVVFPRDYSDPSDMSVTNDGDVTFKILSDTEAEVHFNVYHAGDYIAWANDQYMLSLMLESDEWKFETYSTTETPIPLHTFATVENQKTGQIANLTVSEAKHAPDHYIFWRITVEENNGFNFSMLENASASASLQMGKS